MMAAPSGVLIVRLYMCKSNRRMVTCINLLDTMQNTVGCAMKFIIDCCERAKKTQRVSAPSQKPGSWRPWLFDHPDFNTPMHGVCCVILSVTLRGGVPYQEGCSWSRCICTIICRRLRNVRRKLVCMWITILTILPWRTLRNALHVMWRCCAGLDRSWLSLRCCVWKSPGTKRLCMLMIKWRHTNWVCVYAAVNLLHACLYFTNGVLPKHDV